MKPRYYNRHAWGQVFVGNALFHTEAVDVYVYMSGADNLPFVQTVNLRGNSSVMTFDNALQRFPALAGELRLVAAMI